MSALAKFGNSMNTQVGLLFVVIIFIGFLALSAFTTRKVLPREYRGQFLVILALIYISLVFLIITYSFRKSGQVTAAMIPRLWIFGLLACCLYLLINIFRKKESRDPESGSFKMPLLYIVSCIAYVALMPLLGFFIASFLFLIAGIVMLHYHRWMVIMLISVGWIAFNYLLFYRLFFVSFPQGIILNL